MSQVSGSKGSAAETGVKGEFQRKDSTFRDFVKKGGQYPPEGEKHKKCALIGKESRRITLWQELTINVLCSDSF